MLTEPSAGFCPPDIFFLEEGPCALSTQGGSCDSKLANQIIVLFRLLRAPHPRQAIQGRRDPIPELALFLFILAGRKLGKASGQARGRVCLRMGLMLGKAKPRGKDT